MNLSFHTTAPGISWTVETSTDFENWLTDDVVISDLDIESQRTASVERDTPRHYLRLVVFENPGL